MFKLFAKKNVLEILQKELVTSGSVNVYPVQFVFDSEWNGLQRTAVFWAGNYRVSVLLDNTGMCTIPWEVMQIKGRYLYAGVYGTKDGEIVLPTMSANLGQIYQGTEPGESFLRRWRQDRQGLRPQRRWHLERGLMPAPNLDFSVSGTKISDESGFNYISVTFSADAPYQAFECRATKLGEDWGQGKGVLVASFSQTPAGTSRTFEVYDDDLVNGDGEYRISLYAQGMDGSWNDNWGFIPSGQTDTMLTADGLEYLVMR